MLLCNARVLNTPLTGVQRYTIEVLNNLPAGQVKRLAPPTWLRRPFNLAWEQAMLPLMTGGRLLWSPANTGPAAVANQVVTVHDLSTLEYPQEYSKLYRAYYNWLFPRLLPRARGVLTVSEYTRQRLLETYGLPEDRVLATPLGVDHAHFYPRDAGEIAALKNRLGIKGRYVLYVGTLSGRKNVGLLVDAWRQMQARVDDDLELVIGGGQAVAHVFNGSALPLLPPRTRLLGRVADADLPALMSGAQVFCFPSLFEGFGLPPLEAMACGAPCVVSNVTSLPEVVGDAALQVDPLNLEELADALTRLLTDGKLHGKLAAMGIRRAASFTWQKTGQASWRFFEKAGA